MAAWIWNGPGRPSRAAASSRRRPSAMAAASHSVRSCSASTTRSPSASTRAALRASWNSMSASRPSASGSSGISVHRTRPRRMASAVRLPPDQVGARAGGIPLVEEEVEDGQHRGRALHQLVRRRHGEGDARVAYLALGPDEPLGHGGLGHQEGAGDLGRRHAGQRAQGQRHLGLEGQGRVAAGEHQAEPVVGHVLVRSLDVLAPRRHDRDLPRLGLAQARPPGPVDGPVARHRREPGAGAARDAVTGPALQRGREGILRALLGEVPVAGQPDQGGDHPAPLGVERLGDGGLDVGRHISQIGLTSIDPSLAPGMRAATSMASSRSLQSTRK